MSLRRVTAARRLTFPRRASAVDLERLIRERILSRLGSRVRNLAVAVDRGVIHLAGQCSTYYTKQLAQHVTLGVVEDEVIDNAIEVTVPNGGSVQFD
ncbi:BON domain-containing protein [Botrimarina mediterranea]|uniref:BON domain-containing protein n=1 Tax=Botrimarina mediterranea TaxID=2528022 RepID=UPI00118C2349|nr:hypothetical protein K2D_38080 [Planctomycetes bacterium K2D]